MRWILSSSLTLSLCLFSAPVWAASYCSFSSRCASIVMDGGTGRIIESDDADKQVYPASLTKMMTLYLFFEAIQDGRFDLTDRIPVSAHAAAQSPSKIGLRAGQTITVEDAIEAIAVKSANDIAMAVAEAVGGSERGFVRRMNAKASSLGMRSTNFENPSGLPDFQQQTTARDMVTLARRVLVDFPARRHYFGLPSAMIAGKRVAGHNRLLKSGDCTGGKTGYINASGYNLVAWKEVQGRVIIGAVFGGDSIGSRDRKMAGLLQNNLRLATTMRLNRDSLMEADNASDDKDAIETKIAQAAKLDVKTAPQVNFEDEEKTDKKGTTVASLIEDIEPDSESEAVAQTLSLADVATSSPTFDESWAIQVGAYREEGQAQQALSHATRALPVLLGAAFPRTLETATNLGQLHRAQLVGLDETSAKSACASLTKQGMQCLAVPPAHKQAS